MDTPENGACELPRDGVNSDISSAGSCDDAAHRLRELEAIYAQVPVGLCVLDRELRWVRINDRLATFNGFEASHHIGKRIRDLLPALADKLEPILRRILTTGEPVFDVEVSAELPGRSGAPCTWRASYYPIKDAAGLIAGINVVAEDITEQRRGADEHAAHRKILNLATSGAPLDTVLGAMVEGIENLFPGCVGGIVQYEGLVGMVRHIPRLDGAPVPNIVKSAYPWLQVQRTSRGCFVPDLALIPVAAPLADPGDELLCSARIRSIRLSNGDIWGAFGVFSPIPAYQPTDEERTRRDLFIQLAATVIERQQLFDALRTKSERLQLAEIAGGIGVYDWNIVSSEIVWTEQMELLYGLRPGEFDGGYETWREFVHPEDIGHIERMIDDCIDARRRDYHTTYRIRLPNGEIRWIESFGHFTFSPSGDPIWMIGTCADITVRKESEERARQAREQLELALETGELGLWDWNIESGAVQYGGTWFSMLGYTGAEGFGRVDTWKMLLHPDDRERVLETIQRHLAGDEPFYQSEHRLLKKDGTWLWVLDRGRVVERDSQGRALRAVGVHTDVTEHHAAREELRNAGQKKDEFLATLAHELRNPLAPLRTGLQVLKMSTDPDEKKVVRKMMERQLGHMVALIDDLLDIARVTQGRLVLKREKVSLQSVISTAVESVRPIIDAAGHTLRVDMPSAEVIVDGDVTRLAQIISNVLNNAAKYTPNQGMITLSVRTRGSEVAIKIADTGIGIPPEMLEEVFAMFRQVGNSLDRSQGGLGIGLALVRRLVEMHGGEITATSPGLGQGSTFTITLPQATRDGVRLGTTAVAGLVPERAPHRVLVVDDNVDAATSLTMYIKMLGHSVETVHSGPDAVAYMGTFGADTVFLDIGLPGLNGYEVAGEIRAMPGMLGVRLVAVTGWGAESDKKQAFAAGFDEHLTKPVDLAEIDRILVGEVVMPVVHS